ncbi:hypothetical protein BCR34DRAFT_483019 [Clohesyomyces aquaticus]|uniref:Uncharacterized protein n=1 Tax=Clohesyomyces aquaticus TaxID=1231657 RepID=A0A1Y1ZPM7_9PLEO|nr:hypothetical protein BCR34DRAFT_483019 [Clohesyomyces aquaticus]
MKLPAIKLPSKLSSVTSKIPQFKRQPVFNRPVPTSHNSFLSRALYITLLAILVAFSSAVIALKALTLNFIYVNQDMGFVFEIGDDAEPTILAALPRMLFMAPAQLAIVAAAMSVCMGIGHGVFIMRDWKTGTKTQNYSFRRNTMFLHLVNTLTILFSLISIYVTHKSTSHFHAGYVTRKANISPNDSNSVRYNAGTFDLETWSCELQTEPGAEMVWEDYGRQCRIEMAGRAIMIPFLITGVLVAGFAVSALVGGKRVEEQKTWDKQTPVKGDEEEDEVEMRGFNAI